MRARIGRDLLVLPSVAVMLFDEEGRLLMAKDGGSSLWMTIGGAIDPDEAPADAAVREFWEETGLLVHPVRLLGVFGGRAFRITYPNGDVVSYTVTAFEARRVAGDARPDGLEAVALRFVSRDDAADLPMAGWTREIVRGTFEHRRAPYFAPPAWTPPESRPG